MVALRSTRIVDTFETISGGAVAVADRVRIDVRITVARFANANRAVLAGRVAEVTVAADVAFGTCRNARIVYKSERKIIIGLLSTSVSFRTFQTDDRILADQNATPLVGTRTQFTIQSRSL